MTGTIDIKRFDINTSAAHLALHDLPHLRYPEALHEDDDTMGPPS
jgi:hypothetical protein